MCLVILYKSKIKHEQELSAFKDLPFFVIIRNHTNAQNVVNTIYDDLFENKLFIEVFSLDVRL